MIWSMGSAFCLNPVHGVLAKARFCGAAGRLVHLFGWRISQPAWQALTDEGRECRQVVTCLGSGPEHGCSCSHRESSGVARRCRSPGRCATRSPCIPGARCLPPSTAVPGSGKSSATLPRQTANRRGDPGACDELLWQLKDEPARSPESPALPSLASGLRIFVVSGAFGDCRGLDTIPYGTEIQHLAAQGVRIEAVMVSGRSSTERNARQLAEAIQAAGIEAGDRIVLIGYSKGAVDILQFLADFPQLGTPGGGGRERCRCDLRVATRDPGRLVVPDTVCAIVRKDVRPRRWPGHHQPRARDATAMARRAPAADPRCLFFAGCLHDWRTPEPRAESDVAHPRRRRTGVTTARC